MRREAAASCHLGPHSDEVVLVTLLVSVREHEVEGSGKRRHDLVRVTESRVDVRRQAGYFDVRNGRAMPFALAARGSSTQRK